MDQHKPHTNFNTQTNNPKYKKKAQNKTIEQKTRNKTIQKKNKKTKTKQKQNHRPPNKDITKLKFGFYPREGRYAVLIKETGPPPTCSNFN